MLDEKSRPIKESGIETAANIQKFAEIIGTDLIKKITWEVRYSHLLTNKVEKLPCIVEPFLPKVGLVSLTGSSDSGKSAFLRDLAVRITTGKETFLGYPIHSEHKSVIYVSSEDDEYAVSFLAHKQNEVYRFETNEVENLRFIFETDCVLDKLRDSLEAQPADIVIVDCYADFFNGQINQTNEVRDFLNDYGKLAKDFKCLVIFLHHTRKGSENFSPSKNNVLGSQGFEAKMRLIMELRKDPKAVGTSYLCFTKGNYLPDNMKKNAVVLQFLPDSLTYLSTGETIPIDEIVVADQKPKSKINQEVAILLNEKLQSGISQNQACKELGLNPADGTRLKEKFPDCFNSVSSVSSVK